METTELWDGRVVLCEGRRDGLPWWKWGDAPKGLVTKTQLWEQGLRRSRGQDVYGYLVWWKSGCGLQVASLFRIEEAILSRPMSERWAKSIENMRQAHRICRGCGREHEHYLSTRTWRCWACMEATGDFGEPDHHRLTTRAR